MNQMKNPKKTNDFEDCFFGLEGVCYHIKAPSITCIGKECKKYKSINPLKNQIKDN